MDAPLPDFGLRTWAGHPTMLTIDAFGCSTGMVRGLFEYLYAADTLTLVPHLPDNVTALRQKFPVRWGAYSLFISTTGVRGSGIARATVNGSAAPIHGGTSVVLSYADMPPASTDARAATDSDVIIASTRLDVNITFNQRTIHPTPAPAPPPAPTPALHLVAADLQARGLKPGAGVTTWTSRKPANTTKPPVTLRGGTPPTLAQAADGHYAVLFDGASTALRADLEVAVASTIVAVVEAHPTTNHTYSPVVHLGSTADHGLAVTPVGCATGNPLGPWPCNASTPRVLCIDWSGSDNMGWRDITSVRTVVSVTYAEDQAGLRATSAVNGCSAQQGAR